jgi:hypothetical protein
MSHELEWSNFQQNIETKHEFMSHELEWSTLTNFLANWHKHQDGSTLAHLAILRTGTKIWQHLGSLKQGNTWDIGSINNK